MSADAVKPEIVADWWYCGDEICRCSYPRIRRLTPPATKLEGGGTRYAKGEVLEEGPWVSEPDTTELREQWTWMLAAARRHGADNLAEIEDEATTYLDLTTNP